jgi:hypothetical protein
MKLTSSLPVVTGKTRIETPSYLVCLSAGVFYTVQLTFSLVFLRQLEYYSGILFLTANRVGVLDEAFKSRINISLRYPRFGLAETKRV